MQSAAVTVLTFLSGVAETLWIAYTLKPLQTQKLVWLHLILIEMFVENLSS